jgi:hypothetical protein
LNDQESEQNRTGGLLLSDTLDDDETAVNTKPA